MKEVILEEIGFENFCCYIEPMTLQLESQGLTCITGPNGIGKTTILDVIPYVLYGITSKGLKGDDVVNDVVKKNCKVWLKFRINDIKYEAIRYVKHYKNGNTAYLYRGSELIKKGHTEVKAEIERLTISQKLFFNTLLFGQKIKDFFTNLTDSEQKDIFRNIINLNKYVIYRDQASKKLDDLNNSLNKISNEIEINSKILTDTETEINKLLKNKETFYIEKDKELNSILSDIEEIKNQIDLINKDIEYYGIIDINGLNTINNMIINFSVKISEIQTNKNNINNDIINRKKVKRAELEKQALDEKSKIVKEDNENISKIKEEISELKLSYTNDINSFNNLLTEMNHDLSKLNDESKNLEKELKEISNILLSDKSRCSTCKQLLNTPESIEIFKQKEILNRNRLGVLDIEIKSFTEEINKKTILKNEIESSFKNSISILEDIYKNAQAETDVKTSKVDNKLKDVLDRLETIAKKEVDSKTLEIDSEINKLKNQIHKCNSDKSKIESDILSLKNLEDMFVSKKNDLVVKNNMLKNIKIRSFDDSIIDSYKLKNKILKSKIDSGKKRSIEIIEMTKVYEFWKVAYSSIGIPSMLIDESIPFMNKRVSYYLDKLTSGRFTLSFDTMRENKSGEFKDKISIHLVDNHTHANSRTKLSGGQTRLIDIATILTLYDLQCYIQDIKFNVMIFDEIFDSLDEDNIRYVSILLKSLILDKSIFIISHRHIDQLEADNELNLWN